MLDAWNTHHNGRIMASRIFALLIWAAVAASLAYWGLRWLAPSTGVPANATRVSLDGDIKGDLHRLLAGPSQGGSSPVDAAAASALGGRLKLIGAVAPRDQDQRSGVALISVDGKPPRAVRIGGVIDGDMVLQSLDPRSAQIGPAHGPAALTLNLPTLPAAATGTLPPPAGLTAPPPVGSVPPPSARAVAPATAAPTPSPVPAPVESRPMTPPGA